MSDPDYFDICYEDRMMGIHGPYDPSDGGFDDLYWDFDRLDLNNYEEGDEDA